MEEFDSVKVCIDFACPADGNIRCKEIEKFQNLAIELQRLWNVKVNIVIGTLGTISPFSDWLRDQL